MLQSTAGGKRRFSDDIFRCFKAGIKILLIPRFVIQLRYGKHRRRRIYCNGVFCFINMPVRPADEKIHIFSFACCLIRFPYSVQSHARNPIEVFNIHLPLPIISVNYSVCYFFNHFYNHSFPCRKAQNQSLKENRPECCFAPPRAKSSAMGDFIQTYVPPIVFFRL